MRLYSLIFMGILLFSLTTPKPIAYVQRMNSESAAICKNANIADEFKRNSLRYSAWCGTAENITWQPKLIRADIFKIDNVFRKDNCFVIEHRHVAGSVGIS